MLDNRARLLVERETIFSEEVEMLMQGKSVEEIIAFMDENKRTLNENPFERKKSVIVSEKELNKQNKKADESVEAKEETDKPQD